MKNWSVSTATLYYLLRGMGYGVGFGALLAVFARIIAPFDPIGDVVGGIFATLAPDFIAQQEAQRAALGLPPSSTTLNILPLIPGLLSTGIAIFFVAWLAILRGRRKRQQNTVRIASYAVTVGSCFVIASILYLLAPFL